LGKTRVLTGARIGRLLHSRLLGQSTHSARVVFQRRRLLAVCRRRGPAKAFDLFVKNRFVLG
jgi:hypothetical protein